MGDDNYQVVFRVRTPLGAHKRVVCSNCALDRAYVIAKLLRDHGDLENYQVESMPNTETDKCLTT